MYKSERFLDEFLRHCFDALATINIDNYEIIFVNDGSPDNSLNKILEIKGDNEKIIVIDLSRNFGHHYAIMAGLSYSKGDLVFLIDCDLEVSPKHLITFYNTFNEKSNCDVIYGVQEKRKGGIIEKSIGGLFYKLFNHLTEIKIQTNILTERLMNRKYVEELIIMGDKNIFLAGMMQWIGFNQIPITITKGTRIGKPTYTFQKRLSLSLQAITSFSSYPLILLFKVGILISVISSLWGGYNLINKFFYPDVILSGFTSIIVLLLFSLGLIMSSLGIIGVYISKLYNQTKDRQTYIVKDIYK